MDDKYSTTSEEQEQERKQKQEQEQYAELEASYQTFLKKAQRLVRIGGVNRDRTIELIEAAKGKRSLRQFAEDLQLSAPTLSRILNGSINSIKPEYLVKIALNAEPGSDVSLDELLKAQGWGNAEDNLRRARFSEEMCSRIIAYELLKKGCSVSFLRQLPIQNRVRPDLSITTDAVQGDWLFEIKLFPETAKVNIMGGLRFALNTIMIYYYTGGKAGRYTLVVTTSVAYEEAKRLVKNYGPVPDEISIMYVSMEEEKIIDEYILPLTEGRQAQSLFSQQTLPSSDSQVSET